MRNSQTMNSYKKALLSTPLGDMIALSESSSLILLQFSDQINLPFHFKKLKIDIEKCAEDPAHTLFTDLRQSLDRYFQGSSFSFKGNIKTYGTSFQKTVWEALAQIPLGQTLTYKDLAQAAGQPHSFRAVAAACAANPIALIVPCHRIIQSNGKTGGYAGGVHRKRHLLNLEKEGQHNPLNFL